MTDIAEQLVTDILKPKAGAQPGNNFRMKWKTPEERQKAYIEVCKELEQGFPQEYLATADWDTIERYMRDFPDEFPPEGINNARREGDKKLLAIGYTGMLGKIPGFVPRTWEFIIQNKTKWKLRQDVTTDDKKIESPIVYIPAENKDA